MRKEIRQVSDDGKIVRVTVADERFYIKTMEDGSLKEYPSVTWIADQYPKGIGFYMYLANKGWENSQSELQAAGNRGTKVHSAISSLLLGNDVKMDDKLPNSKTGEPEDLTLEEYQAIISFSDWYKETNPRSIENDKVVFSESPLYAGTVDYVCEINGEKWLIDFKTSKEIWPSYELQLAAYKHALPKEIAVDKMAILQVGYGKNRKGFKFTEIPDQYELFLAARQIWLKECEGMKPFVKDYPTSISLTVPTL